MGERKPIGREVLIKGYLRKAPSARQKSKNQGLTVLFGSCKAFIEPKWKKRFCIFYKIRNPTETQIFFEYYEKESDKHPRGCVDLNSCHCIYEQKSSNQWPNVFVVQTTFRGKRRDYLFSANTPEEMNDWITQLTKVLQMVPDHVSGPPSGGNVIAHNGSSPNYFSQRHTSSSPKVPSYSLNSNQLFGNTYVDRALTEEYRTSFGEAPAEDEDCYHILPQPDHAYVNLKGNGAAGGEASFLNGQDRPDSVYFNVWDSSTVDVNGDNEGEDYRNGVAKPDKVVTEGHTSKTGLQTSIITANMESSPIVNETELPKRCRNHNSSSSSSDELTDEESDSKNVRETSGSPPLVSAGEADVVSSSLSESVSTSIAEVSNTKVCSFLEFAELQSKSAVNTTAGSGIQYLDAENLDFSLRQRTTNAAPLIPPKPVHLRRNPPKETNLEGGTTGANENFSTTKEKNSEDNSANTGEYFEMDVRSTEAFFTVAKKMLGDENGDQSRSGLFR